MSKITVWIPSMPQRSYAYRRGDAQVIYDDSKNAIVIDGGEDFLCDQIIKYCKIHGITHITYILSHWHYDHDRGMKLLLESSLIVDKVICPPPADLKKLRDSDAVDDYNRAVGRIAQAKGLGKTIIYPDADKITTFVVGAIKCNVWRRSVRPSENVDYQVNNTSLVCYFPDLYYLTSGDTINAFDNYLSTHKDAVRVFKIPHHGNACTNTPCDYLLKAGAKLCWYNHAEAYGTSIGGDEFSKWGAAYCKRKGFVCLRPFWGIQMTACDRKLTVSQNGSKWVYDIPYEGKAYEGWISDNGAWWYQYSDASYAIGWKKLSWSGGESWFYFDANGWMQTGWIKTGGYWYYLDKTTGAMLTGWLDYNGKKCYLEPVEGKNQGHAYCNETVEIDGETYTFDKDCYVVTGEVEKTNDLPEIHQNTGFRGYNVSKRYDAIMYIVIHYVGAESTAKNNIDYFNRANRNASADFFVGHSGEIWQYNPNIKAQYSWHCGGGRQSSRGGEFFGICKNSNSIGIELCTKKVGGAWTFSRETVDAAIKLVLYLMDEYGIPASKVITHFNVNGKYCPAVSGWGAVGGDAEWKKFKASLTGSTNYVESAQTYRVRTSWEDARSQIGAFANLGNAKALADASTGYHVYDNSGNMIQ